MTPLPDRNKWQYKHSFIHCTSIGQTDGRTELVKQYRTLHALHADARLLQLHTPAIFSLEILLSWRSFVVTVVVVVVVVDDVDDRKLKTERQVFIATPRYNGRWLQGNDCCCERSFSVLHTSAELSRSEMTSRYCGPEVVCKWACVERVSADNGIRQRRGAIIGDGRRAELINKRYDK